jgi:hypothetical protein
VSGTIADLTTDSQPLQPDVEEDIEADMDSFPGVGDEDEQEA